MHLVYISFKTYTRPVRDDSVIIKAVFRSFLRIFPSHTYVVSCKAQHLFMFLIDNIKGIMERIWVVEVLRILIDVTIDTSTNHKQDPYLLTF